MPIHSGEIHLDLNGLYILLTDTGADARFHWGLYLASEPERGVIFHAINGPQTGHKWEYQVETSPNVPKSGNLLVAIKIAIIDPVLHNPLIERIAKVPVQDSSRYGPITCRVWLKAALEELDQEGYISLTGTVNDVETDAADVAMRNKIRSERTVMKSTLCRA